MAMPKKMALKLVGEHGWEPYIKRHWMILGLHGRPAKAGYTVAFRGHNLEYDCSYATYEELKDARHAALGD